MCLRIWGLGRLPVRVVSEELLLASEDRVVWVDLTNLKGKRGGYV
jgi:hypothetical protein